MMRHDPILRFAKVLKEQHEVAEADLEAMDKDVQAQVAEAVRFADQSPWPAPGDALRGRLRALALHPPQGRRQGPRLARLGRGGPGPRARSRRWAPPAAPAKVEG